MSVADLQTLDPSANADLIVFCQSERRLNTADLLVDCRQRWPLTSILRLLGSMCEGEIRSGNTQPGFQRRFWYQWQFFIDDFVEHFRASQPHPGQLPPTFNELDRVLWNRRQPLERRLPYPSTLPPVVVGCRWDSEYRVWHDLLNSWGIVTRWVSWAPDLPKPEVSRQESAANPELAFIVGDSVDAGLLDFLQHVRDMNQRLHLLLVLNFPRLHEVQWASKNGVSRVIGKPFDNDELRSSIGKWVDSLAPDNEA